MAFHGIDLQDQRRCNLRVGASLRHKMQHLSFTISQGE